MEARAYVVGGAVRDILLGREPKDIDYVWVGQTAEAMLDMGFEQVGADFPVFLDSDGNEHALARKERKVAAGYNGFEVNFDPSVTLQDDLVRRDLTINAMAVPVAYWNEFVSGDRSALVDYFNGQSDLNNKILRHVSAAFAEDPVRVLRVARFAARYEFDVSLATIALMNDLVAAGELDALVPERVWAETERALLENNPMAFFRTLKMCRADRLLFPELKVNGFLETCLNKNAGLADLTAMFALMCLQMESDHINSLCERLKVPNDCRQLALHAVDFCNTLRSDDDLTPELLVSLYERVRARSFGDLWGVGSVADMAAYNTARYRDRLQTVMHSAPHVLDVRFTDLTQEQQENLKGPDVGAALRELKLERATEALK